MATIQNYYGGLWTFVGTDYEPFVVGFYMYFVRVFCYVDIKSDGPKLTLTADPVGRLLLRPQEDDNDEMM